MNVINQYSAQQILQQGQQAQSEVSQAFDSLWLQLLNSPLYDTMNELGRWFAVGTLVLFIIDWVKDLQQEDMAFVPWEKWLWVVVVIALFSNQGDLMRDCTLGLRNLFNTVNQKVLTSTSNSTTSLIEAYTQASNGTGIQGWYQQELLKCQSIANQQQKQKCEQDALNTANQVANISGVQQNWWQKLVNGATAVISFPIENSITNFLLAFGVAIQWLVELTWLLMAMAAPMAVGGTLLPVQKKSLIAWLIGFYAVGLYKLFFNMLVGMVAMVQVMSGSTLNGLIFSIATGLLSPILAMTLAAGGGLATLSAIGSVAAAVAGAGGAKALGMGIGAAKGGIRMAGHPIKNRVGQAYSNRVSPAMQKRVRSVGNFIQDRKTDAKTPLF